MGNEKIIINWDFDETLGHFREAWNEFRLSRALDKPMPENVGCINLRSDVKEVLESMSDFIHVLTTRSDGEYASLILERFEIREHFYKVYGNESGVVKSFLEGKDYGLVASDLGLTEDEAKRRMIAIGDDYNGDRPMQDPKICLVYDRDGMNRSAKSIEKIVRKLVAAGSGNVLRGFEILRGPENTGDSKLDGRIEMDSKLCIDLSYFGNYSSGDIYPVVTLEYM